MKVTYKRGNIMRVIGKVVVTLIALYAGGTIIEEVGNVMNGTTSPLYKGLTLIGWSVDTGDSCAANEICSTSGSGILAVIGIIGIASVVLEFVNLRF